MKNKYNITFFLIIIVIISSFCFACSNHSKETYILNYYADDGGYILGETTQIIEKNSASAPVTAIANQGYTFIKWSDGVLDATRFENNISTNLSFTALFSENEKVFTVQYMTEEGGSISGLSQQYILQNGSASSVTAVPNIGYKFTGWSDGIKTPSRTDSDITADLEVMAQFEKQLFTLEFAHTEGGSIIGEATQKIMYGEHSSIVIAIADDGYDFVGWSDNFPYLERPSGPVISDLSATAIFARKMFSLNYDATYQQGKITGPTSQTIFYGDSGKTVTAQPHTGYRFTEWSDGINTAERTDTNIKENLSVVARFEKIKFSVTYLADNGGTISGNKNQIIDFANSATQVTAVPQTGYKFIGWSDGVKTPSRIDQNIITSINVVAQFERIEFNVIYTAKTGGSIIGEKTQTVGFGSNASSVTAIADAGYIFDGWSDGITTAQRTDLNILDNKTVVANFRFVFFGNGTTLSPYSISSYADLNNMRYFPTSNFKLIENLDLRDVEDHYPIFDNSFRFEVNFDGNGKIISNLSITKYTNLASLFGFVGENGLIENLNMTGISITIPNYLNTNLPSCTGAVCGVSLGTLKNINVDVAITAPNLDVNGHAIGGLVGQSGGKVENCSSQIQVQLNNVALGGQNYSLNVGGLVGVAESNLISCHSSGHIKVSLTTNDFGRSIGGLVGAYAFNPDISMVKLDKCTASVDIENNNTTYCGGLFGYCSISTPFIITNSETNGKIENKGSSGGMLGSVMFSDLHIENCSANSNIIGTSKVGGFIGALKLSENGNAKIINCSATGNVSGGSETGGFIGENDEAYFYRCFATGNVNGNAKAAGFIFIFRGTAEECFSLGEVSATSMAAGFAGTVVGDIINCYSKSNVVFINTESTTSVVGGGLAVNLMGSIENSYYTGKISGSVSNSSRIGAIAGVVNNNSEEINNCHWLFIETGLAEFSIGSSTEISVEATRYEDIINMYNIADLLNITEESPWIDIEGDTPQLTFILLP